MNALKLQVLFTLAAPLPQAISVPARSNTTQLKFAVSHSLYVVLALGLYLLIVVAPVDAFPNDISPYGVLNMAGNVLEWTRTPRGDGFFITRGGDAYTTPPHSDHYRLSYENARSHRYMAHLGYGFRCVMHDRYEVERTHHRHQCSAK